MNFKKLIRNKKVAFTLAEVVVVMAILSVMMVAFAPVVTKKTISTGSNNNKVLFDTATGTSGIYYGSVGDTKSIIIGENRRSSTYHPKLLIVSTSDDTATNMTPHIGFASNYDATGATTSTYSGQLMMQSTSGTDYEYKGNLVLGGRANSSYKKNDSNFEGNTVIGVEAGYTAGSNVKNVTAIGAGACRNHTIDGTICLGAKAGYGLTADSSGAAIFMGTPGTSYSNKNIRFGSTSLESILSTAFTDANLATQSYVNGSVAGLASTATTSALSTRLTTAEGNITNLTTRTGSLEGRVTALEGASDIRLKNIGKEFTAGLDEINQLTFYNYTYKRDSEKTPRVGVMAQDLQKVFPNAVSENKEGYLYIRKDDMFYAALNAIKQLFTKSNDNSDRIKELEDRNAVLEKQVKELQQMYLELAKQTNAKAAKKQLTQTPEKTVVVENEVSQEP